MSYINFHTTNIIQSAPTTSDVFKAFDIVVPDGIAHTWALRILGKLKTRDRIVRHLEGWVSLLYSLAIEQGWGVYLLGGDLGIAARSAENLKQGFPGIKIVGTCHGHFSNDDELQNLITDINQSGATILLVATIQRVERILSEADKARLAESFASYINCQKGLVLECQRGLLNIA